MARLGIIDKVSARAVDLFKLVLLERFENTHLPEMYDVLGPEAFVKLIDVFENSTFFLCPKCGESLRFPSAGDMTTVLRDISIFFRLQHTQKGKFAAAVRDAARDYDLTTGKIRGIFYALEKASRRYEFSLKK